MKSAALVGLRPTTWPSGSHLCIHTWAVLSATEQLMLRFVNKIAKAINVIIGIILNGNGARKKHQFGELKFYSRYISSV